MLVIDSSDAIRGIAEVASKLDFIVNGYVGTTATQLADGQLGNAEADLYASGANATVVTSITIVNTDSSARTFTLYLKPSGGTSRAISPVSLDLGVGYSFYTDGQRMVVMDLAGQVLHGWTVDDTAGGTDGLVAIPISSNVMYDHTANTTTAHGAVSAATASKHVVRDASARAKFAAPGASGDALIKGTRVTTAELPAMTDEKIWKGTGTNVEEIDVPAGATKEFFALATQATTLEPKGLYPCARATQGGGTAYIGFNTPHDFTTITAAVIVCLQTGSSANRDVDIGSEYASIGQVYTTHQEADNATTYTFVANQWKEIDISGILSALVAGDLVGIKLTNQEVTGHVFVLGVRFKYS